MKTFLDENDEPLRELCFNYRNDHVDPEAALQKIVAFVRVIDSERASALEYGHKWRLAAATK